MGKDSESQDARLGGKRKRNILPPTKEKPKSAAGNAVFNLCILAFLGYGFYSYMQKGGDAGIFNELGEKLDVINSSSGGDPRIDALQRKQSLSVFKNLRPVERTDVTTQILQQGEGLPATCGQSVTYRLITGYGEKREVSEVQSLKLGDPQKPLGLTRGMTGMKKGEVRQLKIPQQLWDGTVPQQGQPVRYADVNVELLSMSPVVPEAAMPLRRFMVKGGSGIPLQCGDVAMLHIMVWNSKAERIFSTKEGAPVAFYLGENVLPYGLERGVEGLLPGGEYSLVIPPELWKPLEENASASSMPPYQVQPFPEDMVWPEGEMLLVDIMYPKEVPAAAGANPLPQSAPTVREAPELAEPVKEVSEPVIETKP